MKHPAYFMKGSIYLHILQIIVKAKRQQYQYTEMLRRATFMSHSIIFFRIEESLDADPKYL